MRTVVRFITITAVMAVALSVGEARGDDRPADKRNPALQFELVDGTVITGRIAAKTIAIRISSGNILKPPPPI
jgi:hypothetical protein